MGLKNLAFNLLLLKSKPFRILTKVIQYYIRLRLGSRNYNHANVYDSLGGKFIAEPYSFNDKVDFSIARLVRVFLWSSDLNTLFKSDSVEQQLRRNYEYDFMIKRYFPTKNTAYENLNLNLAWNHSFWNPYNTKLESSSQRMEKYRRSDLLFADFVINSQGIYKAKRIPTASENSERNEQISKLFSAHLQKYKQKLGKEYEGCDNVFNEMVSKGKLFIVEYPELLQIEKKRHISERYKNYATVKNSLKQDVTYKGCLQIPKAIFAQIDDYLPGRKKDFVCLGTVFNERTEVYHPFERQCEKSRTKWEIAKHHIGSAAQNDYIIRVHLGFMHYGSAIYTTAFYNLEKDFPEMKGIKEQFIKVFSAGMLQINKLANITLVDKKNPSAQDAMYLRASQAVDLIYTENKKLDMLQFNPMGLGKDSYRGTAVKMSELYYQKIQAYVDFLFEKYPRWSFDCQKIGQSIYKEVHGGEYCGLSKDICYDKSPKSLKKLMASLMYLWIVHHGETFSMISTNNIFYMAPTFVRKSMQDIDVAVENPGNFDDKGRFKDSVKQQWFAPIQIFNNAMAITKQVTYRGDTDNLVSSWSQVGLKDSKTIEWMKNNIKRIYKWNEYSKKDHEIGQSFTSDQTQHYALKQYEGLDKLFLNNKTISADYWNDLAVINTDLQSERLAKGLFYMHWMLPSEMQNSLNI